jgi:hypothetical protein
MTAKSLDFDISFFYRVALPGAVIGALLLPLLRFFGLTASGDLQLLENLGIAAVVGLLLAAMNEPIYRFYEGRILWPRWLSNWSRRRLHTRVKQQYDKAVLAFQGKQSQLYAELTTSLREEFPLTAEGAPVARAPTRMGNILYAYEDYPMRRYRMSFAFYWYRLWLAVDKDTREELDKSSAPIDALMYLAAGALMAGVLYIVVALALFAVIAFTGRGSAEIPAGFIMIGLAALVGSYLPYRLSLSGHVRNGELFKSLFDVDRVKLKQLTAGTDDERERWSDIWNELQHNVKPVPKSTSVVEKLEALISRTPND